MKKKNGVNIILFGFIIILFSINNYRNRAVIN